MKYFIYTRKSTESEDRQIMSIESDVVVKPSVQTVAKIAKALGVPMEDLVK